VGGFKDDERSGGANFMQDGQLISSMGMEWMGIRTAVSKATNPSKCFLHFKTHIFYHCILYNTVLMLYIFLLYRLKINHVKELLMCIYSWAC
jgi:hypothetical protein